MSISRYDGKRIVMNKEEMYEELLRGRGRKFIKHYSTPKLVDPNSIDSSELDIINHIWKVGDRLYKLAHKYYGDSTLWWVIAYYNAKYTESHITLGDVLEIPFPVEDVIDLLGI